MYGTIVLTTLLYIFLSYTNTYAMQSSAIVTSSDGHVYSIPQHKLDTSLTFVKKQLYNNPIPCNLSKNELDLFFDAYDAGESFDSFFDQLSQTKKRTLTIIAGKKYLNSPFLSQKIFNCYAGESIATSVMRPYMEMDKVINYLYYQIVTPKVQNGLHKTQSKAHSFNNKKVIEFNNTTEKFSAIPNILIDNNTYLFSGAIEDEKIVVENYHHATEKTKQQKILFAEAKRYDNLHTNLTYKLTTSTNRSDDQNFCKFRIVTTNNNDSTVHEDYITHDNPIIHSSFSPNGHYIITYSESTPQYPYYTCMITSLGTQENNYVLTNITLNRIQSPINKWQFDPQSRILFIASKTERNDIITTIDPQTGDVIQIVDGLGINIHTLLFNEKSTRMLSCANGEHGDTYALWDTHDIKHITSITSSSLVDNSIINYSQYNKKHNIFMIPTHRGNILLLNNDTGEYIQELKLMRHYGLDTIHMLTFPDNDLCLISTFSSTKKNSSVQLWDLRKKTFIGYIISTKQSICGIGLTPQLDAAIITLNNCKKIRKEFLDRHTLKCLAWIKKSAPLPIMYALYQAYKTRKQKQSIPRDIVNLLFLLPKTPFNVQKIVALYLLDTTYPIEITKYA